MAASGTLGQIIPPSIVLVLIGDIIGVPVGDLFIGAIIPGFILVFIFIVYILVISYLRPELAPPIPRAELAALAGGKLCGRGGQGPVPAACF